jgi:hypothetical protein
MVGLSPAEGSIAGKKMLESRIIQILNNKVFVKDIKEIAKQNAYYHKMQQLQIARQGN